MDKQRGLVNKDFMIMVVGQIISIFGNSLIRFALPLHILKLTGSASAFGFSLGMSVLPMIVLAPVSGIMADRMNRRNIMVALDFMTAVMMAGLWISLTVQPSTTVMSSVLIVLAAIQSLYQPAVQSSVPFLVSDQSLVRANAIVNQVNSLSGLLGPVIGGVIYGFWGIIPIVVIGMMSFFFSALMELFLDIPYVRHPGGKRIMQIAGEDLRDSLRFFRVKPVLIQCALLVASFNLLFDSMILVGIPHIITNQLGLGSQYYGLAQGSLSAGALCGGIIVGVVGARIRLDRTYILFGSTIITVAPMALVLWLKSPVMVQYGTIAVCCFAFMAVCTIFSIMMLTFVQQETPPELIGKVIAYILALCSASRPIGRAVYGVLFERFDQQAYLIFLVTIIANVVITVYAKQTLSRVKSII